MHFMVFIEILFLKRMNYGDIIRGIKIIKKCMLHFSSGTGNY